jgi:ATP synthase protein I
MSKTADDNDPNRGGPNRGEMSPEEKARFERRLSDLGQRLDKASGNATAEAVSKAETAEADAARSRAMGLGFSIAAQLVAGVLIGGVMGYYLDRWLGSAPWLMVLFLMFGFAAGLMNVIRTAREMQKISEAQSKGAKSVPDEADEDK